MISDHDIFFYVLGFVLILPVLMVVAYSLLKSIGVAHPLIYAVLGTPLVIWAAVWIFSLVDDISGHLD